MAFETESNNILKWQRKSEVKSAYIVSLLKSDFSDLKELILFGIGVHSFFPLGIRFLFA